MTPLKVAHLSDSHLLEFKDSEFCGVRTAERLEKIMNSLKDKQYDLLIFTGDIAESGKKESYELLASMLNNLNIPFILIPGNHDDDEILINTIPSKENQWVSPKELVSFKGWHFLHLNTNVKGKAHGEFTESMLLKLKQTMEQVPQNLCLLIHHPLLPINIPFLDKYIVTNPEKALETLTPKVNLVLCGHVHGDYRWSKNGVFFESAPSTGFQFEEPNELSPLNKMGYSIDNSTYGYKEFSLLNRAYLSKTIWCHDEKIS